MDEFDVVVVGGGAAGLNAALVLARARRRVAVVDGGEPRNAPAERMHGFVSRDGMDPARLLEVGRAEVVGYGGELIDGRVTRIDTGFTVHLAGGRALGARRILVATGLRDELPDIPGLRERWGRDVLHCPYCHGHEVRDRPIGVIGGLAADVALHLALILPQWSPDVVFFPNGIELTADERERLTARGVRIAAGRVSRLVVHDDALRGVELADGVVVPRAAVFVGPLFVPHDELLTGLGAEVDDNGWVRTDGTGRTTVPGVWAAGNVANPRAQVVTAAGEGSAAAIALNTDLTNDEVERAVRDQRAAGGPFAASVHG
ncbi:NAD(P)/FAD-dependent oxidoreductase [Pseudonocardia acaciae]|uniref:NAD(P)/FAD-dependent oxidoreductase n=1 Tax=Pseudonocardia acaciae TaxID=551276 RepID=UPI0005665A34|nr:NAD(P)/FAD-dependent oxidoreductase [Pseudonocardia acaciae]